MFVYYTMKMRHISAVFLALVLLTSCSDDSQFRIEGHIEGKPTMNLRVCYYADGVYRRVVTAAREGEFEVYASSPNLTVVYVYDYENKLLATLTARNGEDLRVDIDRDNFYATRTGGSPENERVTAFLGAEADSIAAGAINGAIARYVAVNPEDVVSTVLMTTYFDASSDPVMADSLLESISPAVRPESLTGSMAYLNQRLVSAPDTIAPFGYYSGADTMPVFRPSDRGLSLIAVDANNDFRRDSIVPALKALSRERRRTLGILEISTDPDTIVWRRAIASDSSRWSQGWAAAGLAESGVDRLGVPAIPYFIVCDSTGARLLQTSSPGSVLLYLRTR